MALGTLRDIDTPFDKPWLATFSDGWQVTNYLNLTGGAMTAKKYNSVAAGWSSDSGHSVSTNGQNDDQSGGNFLTLSSAGHKCQLKFTLSDEPNLDEFYENVGATCHA